MSQIPTCLQDGCLPMLSMKLPTRLKYLARALSSPRPIYHPASLVGLIKRADDASLVLKILKRLLEGLTLWRHAGRPLPPTIDLPIAFLSSKPVGWISNGPKDTAVRDQLLTRLRHMVGEKAASEAAMADMLLKEETKETPSVKRQESERTIRFDMDEVSSTSIEKVTIAVDAKKLPIPIPVAAPGGATAAALFGSDGGASSSDFDLNLDDDDEEEEAKLGSDHEEEAARGYKVRKEGTFGAEIPDSPKLVQMKSFAFGMDNFNEEEIAEASPLPEASLEDLVALTVYLDISVSYNISWLQTHLNLVPHLSIAESTQLLGLIRVLITIKPAADQAATVAGVSPFLTAAWQESSSQSSTIDVPGCRFLFAYHNALSVTSSYIGLVNTVAEDVRLSAENPGIGRAINWHTLFPKGLSSVSSLEGNAMIISPLEATQDTGSALNSGMATRYALTTSDLCWAIQCESDDVLLQRTLAMWRRVSTEAGGITGAPKLSWEVLRHVRVLNSIQLCTSLLDFANYISLIHQTEL